MELRPEIMDILRNNEIVPKAEGNGLVGGGVSGGDGLVGGGKKKKGKKKSSRSEGVVEVGEGLVGGGNSAGAMAEEGGKLYVRKAKLAPGASRTESEKHLARVPTAKLPEALKTTLYNTNDKYRDRVNKSSRQEQANGNLVILRRPKPSDYSNSAAGREEYEKELARVNVLIAERTEKAKATKERNHDDAIALTKQQLRDYAHLNISPQEASVMFRNNKKKIARDRKLGYLPSAHTDKPLRSREADRAAAKAKRDAKKLGLPGPVVRGVKAPDSEDDSEDEKRPGAKLKENVVSRKGSGLPEVEIFSEGDDDEGDEGESSEEEVVVAVPSRKGKNAKR